MDQLSSVIEILINNIVKTNVPLTERLLSNLKTAAKSKETARFARINHYKSHKKMLLSLKACPHKHCIECLLESNTLYCEHNQPLTLHEQALFRYSYTRLSTLIKKEMKKTCTRCYRIKPAISFASQACHCECSDCIIAKYQSFEYFCSNCQTRYKNEDIKRAGLQTKRSLNYFCQKCFRSLNTIGEGEYCAECSSRYYQDDYSYV